MSQAKFDPIEEAKVEAPAAVQKKQLRKEPTIPMPAAEEKSAKVVVQPAPEPPKPQPPVASKPATPVKAPSVEQKQATRFRVKNTKTISWYGAMTVMSAGSIVRAAGYGPVGIAKLIAQGVELEPID